MRLAQPCRGVPPHSSHGENALKRIVNGRHPNHANADWKLCGNMSLPETLVQKHRQPTVRVSSGSRLDLVLQRIKARL